MKKIFLMAGIGAASLALGACSQPASEDAGASDSAAVEEPAMTDEASADEATAEEGDDAPAVEGMVEGDRANTTGHTPAE